MSANKMFRNSIIFKLIMIGFLVMVLLFLISLIDSLVDERNSRRNEAVREISAKWGSEQTVYGPILTVPFLTYTDQSRTSKVVKYAHFLPEDLKIDGDIIPNLLHRGIYKIATYNSRLNLSGSFIQPDFKSLGIDSDQVIWNEAIVSIEISDLKGVKEIVKVKWGGQDFLAKFGPGTGATGFIAGVNAPAPLTATRQTYNYSIFINLNGTKALNFVPLGNKTDVKLTSSWTSPSFKGAFLPDERRVDKSGFVAQWQILQLNRTYMRSWLDGGPNLSGADFGVDLLLTVNEYQKTTRSLKYAIMIITLTFLIFFFVEVLNKTRIHPIQYVLVGLALVLFFSLLLALSEHINFNLAYFISGLAIVLVTALYSKSIFKSVRLSLLQSFCLTVIYIFIFVVIQLQDYALLVGNIGLFVVLAIVMFISRKVDWYAIGSRDKDIPELTN